MNTFRRFAGVTVLAASLVVGCSNAEEAAQTKVERQVPVQVDSVAYGTLNGSNQFSGTIIAGEEVNVTPKASGELVEVLVEKGARVKAGDLLARIDDTAERNALKQEEQRLTQAESGLQKAQVAKSNAERSYQQAQASLKQVEATLTDAREKRSQNIDSIQFQIENAKLAWNEAKKNVERMKALREDGLISEVDYENAVNAEERARISYDQAKLNQTQAQSETNLRSVEASVEQARIGAQIAQSAISEADLGIRDAQLAVEQAKLSVDTAADRLKDKLITAPASGELIVVNGKRGEMASPQTPFATIVDVNKVKLSVNATAEQLVTFEVGQAVDVAVAGVEDYLAGVVSYISATSQDSGLFTIEVDLDNGEKTLRPGMFASIVVEETLAEEGLLVPTTAIVERAGESFVFIIEDGIAIQKNVEIVKFDTDVTAVKAEIAADDQIVIKGQNLLEDGNQVEVMEEE